MSYPPQPPSGSFGGGYNQPNPGSANPQWSGQPGGNTPNPQWSGQPGGNTPNPQWGGQPGSVPYPGTNQQSWGGSQPPMGPPPAQPPKSKKMLWFGIGAGVIVVGLIATIIFLLLRSPGTAAEPDASQSPSVANTETSHNSAAPNENDTQEENPQGDQTPNQGTGDTQDSTGGSGDNGQATQRQFYGPSAPQLPTAAGQWTMAPNANGGDYTNGSLTISVSRGQTTADQLDQLIFSSFDQPEKISATANGIYFVQEDESKLLITFADNSYLVMTGGNFDEKKVLFDTIVASS